MATSKEAHELPFCHPMARRPGARLAARAREAEEALVPPGGEGGVKAIPQLRASWMPIWKRWRAGISQLHTVLVASLSISNYR